MSRSKAFFLSLQKGGFQATALDSSDDTDIMRLCGLSRSNSSLTTKTEQEINEVCHLV